VSELTSELSAALFKARAVCMLHFDDLDPEEPAFQLVLDIIAQHGTGAAQRLAGVRAVRGR
jgi:hypothetical protein